MMHNEDVVAPGHAENSDDFTASPRRRVSASVLKWLVLISRFGLAALFVYCGAVSDRQSLCSERRELLSASGFDYRRGCGGNDCGDRRRVDHDVCCCSKTCDSCVCAAWLLIGLPHSLLLRLLLHGEH